MQLAVLSFRVLGDSRLDRLGDKGASLLWVSLVERLCVPDWGVSAWGLLSLVERLGVRDWVGRSARAALAL